MITQLVDWWIGVRRDLDGGRPLVVVTGGSDGVGLEVARLMVRDGADVCLVARDQERLGHAVAALVAEVSALQATQRATSRAAAKADQEVFSISCDLTDDGAGRRLVDELAAKGRTVDVLVNSAGVGQSGPFAGARHEELDQLVALNVSALTELCRAVLPGMIKRRRGGIINIASLGGVTPGPYQAAYYASKAYVISLSSALAWEARGQGVRVMCSAPGPVETGFHARMNAESALYRRLLPALSPEATARATLRAYRGGRTLVMPGVVNRAMALALHVMPIKLRAAIVGILLKPRGPGGDVRRQKH